MSLTNLVPEILKKMFEGAYYVNCVSWKTLAPRANPAESFARGAFTETQRDFYIT